MPGQTPINMGNPMGSPVGGMMPMPNPGGPMGNMMNTTQPIAAGGVSPVLASMMAIPQQQQLSGGQQVIPGTAAQSGGYDMPPMPMGSANAMGIPMMGSGMMQPQMAPSAAPGNIMTAGGNQVPFNQATASNRISRPGTQTLVPPPPPGIAPQSIADFGTQPSAGEPSQESGMPMDFNQMEEQALNRSEAGTRQGAVAVQEYLAKKAAKKQAREQEYIARREAAVADLNRATLKKRSADATADLQRNDPLETQRAAIAAQEAQRAVDQRRGSGQFPAAERQLPSQQHPFLAAIGPRRMRNRIAAADFAAMAGNFVSKREQTNQEGALYDTTYNNTLSYLRRDTSADSKQAASDIKDARQELRDLNTEFNNRTKQERQDDLDDLHAKLSQVRLAQGAAQFEGATGHRGVTEGQGALNAASNASKASTYAAGEARQKRGEPSLLAARKAETNYKNKLTGGPGQGAIPPIIMQTMSGSASSVTANQFTPDQIAAEMKRRGFKK